MTSKRNAELKPGRALEIYALVFSLFIGWASLRTVFSIAHHSSALRWLALTEIAGALLFAVRKSRLIGLVILLMVFAIATVVELHLSQWPGRFFFYAASALFVQYLSAESA